MNKSLRHLFAGLALLAFFLCACSNASDSSVYTTGLYSQGGGGPFPGEGTGGAASSDFSKMELSVTYGANASDDALAAVSWSDSIYLDLTNSKYSSDGSNWSAISTDSANPSAAATNVSIYNNSGYIKIDSSATANPIKFILSGSLNGELFFANKKGGVIGIFMNGASIASSNYPCVEFDKKGTVYLNLSGSNSLTDGRKYGTAYSAEHSSVAGYVAEASESKGSFHAKGDLSISAADSSSSLTVTEGYKHGFYASRLINFYGGVVTVNSTGRNGFQCVNGFNMYGGTAIVYGSGTNTNNESRGIVIEGSDESGDDGSGLGYFNMVGGAVNIKTVSKGITAKWEAADDATTADTSDDPNPIVTISGGTINVVTYGTPKEEAATASSFTDADGETVSEKIKLSPEGIEGKAGVTITDGTLNIVTTDDCVNAGGAISISGGSVYARSGSNDAIDSNGTISISGGTVVALTASNPECAFDCDNNNFAITGGTLIGIGTTNYSTPTAASCGQSVVVVGGNYLGSAGTTFALEDSTGAAAFAFTIPSAVYSSLGSNYVAIVSSPKIAAGTSYALYSGVTATGGSNFNGLYTTLPTVSGGSASLTGIATSTSSWVYTNASSGAGQGGQQPGGTPPSRP